LSDQSCHSSDDEYIGTQYLNDEECVGDYEIKVLMVLYLSIIIIKVAEKNSIAKSIAYSLNTKARNLGRRVSYLVFQEKFRHQ
jgi:hypothetical protein